MKTSDVIAFFGTQVKTAEALGMAQSTIAEWRDEPPPIRQIQLEVITAGKLKADPRCFLPANPLKRLLVNE